MRWLYLKLVTPHWLPVSWHSCCQCENGRTHKVAITQIVAAHRSSF